MAAWALVNYRARVTAMLGAAALAALAAGCGSSPQPVSLPATSQPAPTTAAPISPAAAVAAAYTTFWSADGTAERSDPATAQKLLTPYVSEPYLGHLLTQMDPYRVRDEEAYGYVIPHITSVTVTGDRALVQDCQDQSHAALADSRTGKVIPDTYGQPRATYEATLTLGSDGHWQLTGLEQLATSCEPEPSAS
jgi:hypothetical protein